MSTVQLPGSNIFDDQMKMHTGNQKYDVSLAREFQHHLKKEQRKNGVFDHGKKNKRSMERKWTYRQYHVQDNSAVEHQYVIIYLNINQFPELSFCGTHSKPHGARGLSKHYNLRFDTKIGMGVREILRIPCACVACTSMLDKPWIYGIPSYEQD